MEQLEELIHSLYSKMKHIWIMVLRLPSRHMGLLLTTYLASQSSPRFSWLQNPMLP